ncbi:MAG: AAA family ATPase [Chloroflexi bacterium]|nr:AAA family ATPase [Chloroflexota bacterium]
MAKYCLSLLGPSQLTIDGQPTASLTSAKARALLFYLAVEASAPHRRPSLAALLWPESPDELALGSLRRALLDIRQTVEHQGAGSPFLLVTRNSVQWDSHSDWWCDVAAFQKLLAGHEHRQLPIERLREAVGLYRGQFLEGFALDDSPAYEEWLYFKREELNVQAMAALRGLTTSHERRGEWKEAESFVRRQLALEPWNEDAHCALMRVLASSGRRSEALAQYEVCRRILAQELEAEPGRETNELCASIRAGKLDLGCSASSLGMSKAPDNGVVAEPKALFVARGRELASLKEHLSAAMAGQGRVVFVTGEAGSGKSSLLHEFARRAMDEHPDLLAADGSGNAYTGAGDPYLPFREILEMLAGDVEARRASGSICAEQARRLWDALPATAQSIVSHGPDLIDALVPGADLALRARAFVPGSSGGQWLDKLETLVQSKAAAQSVGLREVLFQQVTKVLRDIASHQPLLLLLDDMQWADEGSIGFLFHLGRRLSGSRILIVGAYRPEEVMGRLTEERHPLEPVVNELGRYSGDLKIDLEQADGRALVEALVDAEPNRLGSSFREMLFRHTGGHALFSVELLRGMQERGDLVRDEEGHWVEAPEARWWRLPPRVEAAIAERLNRLPGALVSVLRVASVEGAEFTAEVAAQVLEVQEQEIYRRLSGALSREHQLVTACSLKRLDGRRLSCYRFRHQLFQEYLYRHLDEVERAHRHEAVACSLETLYGSGRSEKSLELAWHFEKAGLPSRAIPYLVLAGERAVQISGHRVAVSHFNHALELIAASPQTRERDELELRVQMALTVPLAAIESFVSPRRVRACTRAYELGERLGEKRKQVEALFLIAHIKAFSGDLDGALALGEQLLQVSEQLADARLIAMAHYAIGLGKYLKCDLLAAQEHLDEVKRHHDPKQGASMSAQIGLDMGVDSLAPYSMILWGLGYPDQAIECVRETIAAARTAGSLLSMVDALVSSLSCLLLSGKAEEVERLLPDLQSLIFDRGFEMFEPWLYLVRGRLGLATGAPEEGIAQMMSAVRAWEASGISYAGPFQCHLLADVCLRTGQAPTGFAMVDKGLARVRATGQRGFEADLYRLKGELLLMSGQGSEVEAEESFWKALELARRQQAKAWELRAATSLARLWRRQGKTAEGRRLLEDVYVWFTEGFGTADLQEAKALLEELAAEEELQAHGASDSPVTGDERFDPEEEGLAV